MMQFFCSYKKHERRQILVVSSWRIPHHVVATLAMMKIQIISAKVENNAWLLATYIKNDMENAIVKEVSYSTNNDNEN